MDKSVVAFGPRVLLKKVQVEGPYLWTHFQKQMLDGTEIDPGYIAKSGPIGQSLQRFRIFKFDGETGKVWRDPKTGRLEEVEPGGIGEIGAQLDEIRPIPGGQSSH
jgi:hypothetical protein